MLFSVVRRALEVQLGSTQSLFKTDMPDVSLTERKTV